MHPALLYLALKPAGKLKVIIVIELDTVNLLKTGAQGFSNAFSAESPRFNKDRI